LERVDNEAQLFIGSNASSSWSDESFTSGSLGSYWPGYYVVTLFVNGVPSLNKMLLVAPAAEVVPAQHDFGMVYLGTPASQLFTVRNSGNLALQLTAIGVTGSDSRVFIVDPGNGSNGSCGTLTPALAAGYSCTILVTFTPVSSGAMTSTLRSSFDNLSVPPVDVVVTGTSLPLPSFDISAVTVSGIGVVSCESPVLLGGQSICAVTPGPGYHLAGFTDNSTDRMASAGSGGYYISNVTGIHLIRAVFDVNHDGLVIPREGAGIPNIGDALAVLRYSVGLTPLTDIQMKHADVAPLGQDGKPKGDGTVDLRDALSILRRVVGRDLW
jgi:hypothetical protein